MLDLFTPNYLWKNDFPYWEHVWKVHIYALLLCVLLIEFSIWILYCNLSTCKKYFSIIYPYHTKVVDWQIDRSSWLPILTCNSMEYMYMWYYLNESKIVNNLCFYNCLNSCKNNNNTSINCTLFSLICFSNLNTLWC